MMVVPGYIVDNSATVEWAGPDAGPAVAAVVGSQQACDEEGAGAAELGNGPQPRRKIEDDGASDMNNQCEYEGILTSWECKLVDITDRACRACCPFRRVRRSLRTEKLDGGGDQRRSDGESATKNPAHYSWWEGMRSDVPERYQRWEGIRERNAILSLAFGIAGRCRKQPRLNERTHLFLLYAAVWFFSYSITIRRRGITCRKAWVETCVPVDRGGGCIDTCASTVVLGATPEGFADFSAVARSSRHKLDINKMRCVESGVVESVCDLPMCARRGGEACISDGHQPSGLCPCDPAVGARIYEVLLYTVAFKLLHYPYWLLYVRDLSSWHWCLRRMAYASSIVIYVFLFTMSFHVLWSYLEDSGAVLWETGAWLISFASLCLFEVVKSFTVGFIVGAYVIDALCCHTVSQIWKFCLA